MTVGLNSSYKHSIYLVREIETWGCRESECVRWVDSWNVVRSNEYGELIYAKWTLWKSKKEKKKKRQSSEIPKLWNALVCWIQETGFQTCTELLTFSGETVCENANVLVRGSGRFFDKLQRKTGPNCADILQNLCLTMAWMGETGMI